VKDEIEGVMVSEKLKPADNFCEVIRSSLKWSRKSQLEKEKNRHNK